MIKVHKSNTKLAVDIRNPVSKRYYNFNRGFDLDKGKTLDNEPLYNKYLSQK